MTDDPFSPDADPYPPAPRITRREAGKLALLAGFVAASCAAPRRLACPAKPADKETCQARFCRYYRPR